LKILSHLETQYPLTRLVSESDESKEEETTGVIGGSDQDNEMHDVSEESLEDVSDESLEDEWRPGFSSRLPSTSNGSERKKCEQSHVVPGLRQEANGAWANGGRRYQRDTGLASGQEAKNSHKQASGHENDAGSDYEGLNVEDFSDGQ
jgi:hypothetical protein